MTEELQPTPQISPEERSRLLTIIAEDLDRNLLFLEKFETSIKSGTVTIEQVDELLYFFASTQKIIDSGLLSERGVAIQQSSLNRMRTVLARVLNMPHFTVMISEIIKQFHTAG